MINRRKEKKDWSQIELSVGIVSLTQRAVLAKNLSVMLQAGLPILDALDIAQEGASGKLKKTIRKVKLSVESGQSLSKSLKETRGVFSSLFINAVAAGEESGSLDDKLAEVAKQLEKEHLLKGKIRSAMLYPIVVLIATFILGMVLSFVVLPKITPLFEGLQVDLPITTRMLIWFSNTMEAHSLIIFSSIVVVVIVGWWLFKQHFTQPVSHWLWLHIPFIKNITRNANLSRFSRTFGTMLRSGLHIDKALEISSETVGNYYFRQALQEVSINIRRGTTIASNLDKNSHLFPAMTRKMVQVGEEAGKLDETLDYLADFYESEVDSAAKALSTSIEPILLVFIGFIVGFLALSIITPIYDITGNIQN